LETAWVEKVTIGMTPENIYQKEQMKPQSKERNILGVFLFHRISGAVTFIPLNEVSHHT
jgi:hypothetical protein